MRVIRAQATRNCRGDPGWPHFTATSVSIRAGNDLRGDPRFDKIVAAAKAASK
jgi:hypothetical protein